jgi:hypothetical protein
MTATGYPSALLRVVQIDVPVLKLAMFVAGMTTQVRVTDVPVNSWRMVFPDFGAATEAEFSVYGRFVLLSIT